MAAAAGEELESDWTHKLTPDLKKRRALQPSPRVVAQTKKIISKHADKIARRAYEHEQLLNKIKYFLGVFCFGTFCYLLGSSKFHLRKQKLCNTFGIIYSR
ncbi:hypothetical protein O6H91_Y374100 [Diphasiastrum complanatum]|nr:hypothetical protein O6H91_Y374100 [Diphasiastrum complanatum]